MPEIRLSQGDISDIEVDAVVNAANTSLQLGSGVAGAIHERGGPGIQQHCDRIGPIELGAAAMTEAGKLPARYVIHAASMNPGGTTTEDSLRSSVRRSLDLATEHRLSSLALPAIGTGVGGFSVQRCAEILFEEVERHLEDETSLESVRFVLYSEPDYRIFEQVRDASRVRLALARLGR